MSTRNYGYLVSILIGISMTSCFQPRESDKAETVIGKTEVKVEDGRLTPEVLWSMGRLGEMISNYNNDLAYTVRYFDLASNKGNTDIYVKEHRASAPQKITNTATSESNIQWVASGGKIAFLRATENGPQIFETDIYGKTTYQISNEEGGVLGFKYSPYGNKIAIIKNVKSQPTTADRYPDLPQSSGMIFNDLNYRHWDEWVTDIPHIFIGDLKDGKLINTYDILEGEPYEAPVKPFGGIEQMCWAPNGSVLVYCSRKLTGRDYALSTNTDLYAYDLESKTTKNLTEGMKGYDLNPVFAPSGKYVVWESMEREGYEADKIRIMALNTQNGKIKDLSKNFDQNAHGFVFNTHSKMLFLSNKLAKEQIYSIDVDSAFQSYNPSSFIRQITEGTQDYVAIGESNDSNCIYTVKMSMSQPSEIYHLNTKNMKETPVSKINDDILSQIEMGRVEERWVRTTDRKSMLTWVIYPPKFDSTKKYPTLLYCQGGPQSTVSQFWSYRWNFQIMAANDYIIVAPNRRGLPGFGQEWLEQISGDYGGQNMKDYLAAIDDVCKEKYVDRDRLGCVGASYGGFSVYWLAGHHQNRFKGFIAHDGMFNLEQQYLETEEMWFVNWDLGGPYWEKHNWIAQRSYANSPHLFVDKWNTPIMIIHGEKDYRIVASQGMAAFNAAILRGLPAELLIFPDENHWVLQPQNGVLWQRRFFNFLDKHVKKLPEKEMASKHYAENKAVDLYTSRLSKNTREKNTESQVAQ